MNTKKILIFGFLMSWSFIVWASNDEPICFKNGTATSIAVRLAGGLIPPGPKWSFGMGEGFKIKGTYKESSIVKVYICRTQGICDKELYPIPSRLLQSEGVIVLTPAYPMLNKGMTCDDSYKLYD
jgi:hypothetical protein